MIFREYGQERIVEMSACRVAKIKTYQNTANNALKQVEK
jgi:hypothetical protein